MDVFSGDGITPLHDAVMYGSKEQVATLVRAGADTGRILKSSCRMNSLILVMKEVLLVELN